MDCDDPYPSRGEADDLIMDAWGVIANAGMNGSAQSPGWNEAAIKRRDRFHVWLDREIEEMVLPEYSDEKIREAEQLLAKFAYTEK